jgi:hypothetical protein
LTTRASGPDFSDQRGKIVVAEVILVPELGPLDPRLDLADQSLAFIGR